MRTLGWFVAMGVVASGCGRDEAAPAADAAVVDPDGRPPLSRAYPGPCGSTEENSLREVMTCEVAYDDADRRTSVECASRDSLGVVWLETSTTWTYDGDRLVAVSSGYVEPGGGVVSSSAWTLTETTVTAVDRTSGLLGDYDTEDERSYDPASLRFVGHPADPRIEPDAPDALIRMRRTRTGLGEGAEPEVTLDATYTYDGAPHTGTRTRTGSDASTRVFVYDADGRLLEDRHDVVTTYEYDGDLLVAIRTPSRTVAYHHDEHGNLLDKVAPDDYDVDASVTTTYDYSCW